MYILISTSVPFTIALFTATAVDADERSRQDSLNNKEYREPHDKIMPINNVLVEVFQVKVGLPFHVYRVSWVTTSLSSEVETLLVLIDLLVCFSIIIDWFVKGEVQEKTNKPR